SFSHYSADHAHLRSFPTRRSSDLAPRGPRRITLAVGGHAKRAQEFAHLLKRGEFVVAALDDGTTRALDVDALDDQLSEDDASGPDRKSTRLNSSHVKISYAVFCLK